MFQIAGLGATAICDLSRKSRIASDLNEWALQLWPDSHSLCHAKCDLKMLSLLRFEDSSSDLCSSDAEHVASDLQ